MKRYWIGLFAFACLCVSMVWAQQASEFKGHDGLVAVVAFSNDGKFLATSGNDGVVKIWDYATGKEFKVLKVSPDKPVPAVAFNNDGTIIATGGEDKSIRFWNPNDGKMTKELAKGHTAIVLSLAFSPDGKYLVSAGADKVVKLWDVKDAKELKSYATHKGSVYSVSFSKDGNQFASCGEDGLVKVYDVKSMNETKTMMVDLPKPVVKEEKPREEPKDKDKDKKPKKDAGKKEEPKELRYAFHVVAFSPDGKQVLTGDGEKYLRYWNVADGKELKKIGPTFDWIYGLAVSRDGKYVATAGYGGSLRVYDLVAGTQIYPDPDKKKTEAADAARKANITYSLTFTPDGKALVTGQHDQKSSKGFAKVTPIGK